MSGVIRIRDPIHGSIGLTPAELAIVDHRVFQRLRGIKQLGFTDQAFPGATHTRYAHSIGAMYVASQMFDAIFPAESSPLPPVDRARLRQSVRLAVLLHDIGHAPASHASESAMPKRSALALPCYDATSGEEQASHEDYTVKLLLHSSLAAVLVARFGEMGITPLDLAHLVTGQFAERAGQFVLDEVDYFPVLHQLVSGEMDADRMDYLQRDSFYTGVSYGKFDMSWLLENLTYHVVDERAVMAIAPRAVFAFEDFLLSRYHMNVSVYYHHIPVGFDSMLWRFFHEAPDDFRLPVDADAYADVDDVTLWSALRRSDNRWARCISRREGFKRVLEVGWTPSASPLEPIEQALVAEGIEHFVSRDRGVLSKYYGAGRRGSPLYVVDAALGQAGPIDDYTRIYERYAQPTRLERIYVRPDQIRRARQIITAVTPVQEVLPLQPIRWGKPRVD
ncbi:MAG: HD domain-containing protein [bacterium]